MTRSFWQPAVALLCGAAAILGWSVFLSFLVLRLLVQP